jgi:hypothetical protein
MTCASLNKTKTPPVDEPLASSSLSKLKSYFCSAGPICIVFSFVAYNNRMEDITFDKTKFDAVLRRMIATKPTSLKDAVAQPKIKKDGTPKRHKTRTVQKMDKP